MLPVFTTTDQSPVSVHLILSGEWDARAGELDPALRAFAAAQSFTGGAGQTVLMPNESGELGTVLFGLGTGRDALAVSALSAKLPAGDYKISSAPKDWPASWTAAGWADGAYRFDAYLNKKADPPRLVLSEDAHAALGREAAAVFKLRDLVNTPAEDMGPDRIQSAISALGETYGARVSVIMGDALLTENFPLVHAVGRAADIPPRLIQLEWGRESDPELALVGKGVAFDSGGLNIKTGDYMRIMKKDMGGAAHAIALAQLVMDAALPVHLKLYIPAVENAVAGNAFRPGDVIKSRKGLTVEIDNTDAEGRLILADTLALACESEPDLLIDFATLTGAARVALGQDLAPFYTDDETAAGELQTAAGIAGDPVWRMPLWDPYFADLKSSIADMQNSGGRMAGSITAAIFLKQFVDSERWMHFDVWAWRTAKYGRPAGAAACGLRSVWQWLQTRYGKA